MKDMDNRLRLRVRKELHLSPFDLVQALQRAGLADDCCEPKVEIVETTDVNEGRTVIISWSLREQKLAVEQSPLGGRGTCG